MRGESPLHEVERSSSEHDVGRQTRLLGHDTAAELLEGNSFVVAIDVDVNVEELDAGPETVATHRRA